MPQKRNVHFDKWYIRNELINVTEKLFWKYYLFLACNMYILIIINNKLIYYLQPKKIVEGISMRIYIILYDYSIKDKMQ